MARINNDAVITTLVSIEAAGRYGISDEQLDYEHKTRLMREGFIYSPTRGKTWKVTVSGRLFLDSKVTAE